MPAARVSIHLSTFLAVVFGSIYTNLLIVAVGYAQERSQSDPSQTHRISSHPAPENSQHDIHPDSGYTSISQSESPLTSPIPAFLLGLDAPLIDELIDELSESQISSETQDESLNPFPARSQMIDDLPIIGEDDLSTQATDLIESRPANLFGLVESSHLVELQPTSGSQNSQNLAVVPEGSGEVISDIQVRFIDSEGNPTDGRTREFIITREFELQPGDVYDPVLAEEGLERLTDLQIIQDATLTLEPAADENQVMMIVSVIEQRFNLLIPGVQSSTFAIIPSVTLSPPPASVLQGPTLPQVVATGPIRFTNFRVPLSFQARNLGGNNQTLALGLIGGTRIAAIDLTFSDPWIADTNRMGYGINAFGMGYISPIFTRGPRDVELEGGATPWVHRIGGGVQVRRQFLEPAGLDAALGISYQRVTVRDDIFLFGSNIRRVDELGNRLTVSDSGRDDLLTINMAAVLDRRDDRLDPNRGFRARVGTDQFIPVGDASLFLNRVTGNFTQYVPLNLFGFTEGPRTLILNAQAGTVIGDDMPPYEAFVLGGSSSVRGYTTGSLGAGRSVVQATAEYRFPIVNFNVFNEAIRLRGSLFFDVASDLGSDDTVVGRPGTVRDKPGTGFGGGFGVNAVTNFGLVRFEVGFGDDGDTVIYFNVGDRF